MKQTQQPSAELAKEQQGHKLVSRGDRDLQEAALLLQRTSNQKAEEDHALLVAEKALADAIISCKVRPPHPFRLCEGNVCVLAVSIVLKAAVHAQAAQPL